MNYRRAAYNPHTAQPVRRDEPPKKAPPRAAVPDDDRRYVFISGGIGDALAVESHLTDAERIGIQEFLYATRKQPAIEKAFRALPLYAHKKHRAEYAPEWFEEKGFWCFYQKHECFARLKTEGRPCHPYLRRAWDLSIFVAFPKMKAGAMPFTGSSLLRHELANVQKFGLPARYAAVCPYSSDKRDAGRDFSAADWRGCLAALERAGLPGVVLNEGGDAVPDDPRLINLTDKTTFLEAAEVLKGASQYVGIDSSLSILAAQVFPADRLAVKTVNPHCLANADCYFAPHKTFPFLVTSI